MNIIMKEVLPTYSYLEIFDKMLQKKSPMEFESFHMNMEKFQGKNENVKSLNKIGENKFQWTFK